MSYDQIASFTQAKAFDLVDSIVSEYESSSEGADKEIALCMVFGFLDIAWETTVEALQQGVGDDHVADLIERRLTLARIATFHKYSENDASLKIVADELKEVNDELKAIANRRGLRIV